MSSISHTAADCSLSAHSPRISDISKETQPILYAIFKSSPARPPDLSTSALFTEPISRSETTSTYIPFNYSITDPSTVPLGKSDRLSSSLLNIAIPPLVSETPTLSNIRKDSSMEVIGEVIPDSENEGQALHDNSRHLSSKSEGYGSILSPDPVDEGTSSMMGPIESLELYSLPNQLTIPEPTLSSSSHTVEVQKQRRKPKRLSNLSASSNNKEITDETVIVKCVPKTMNMEYETNEKKKGRTTSVAAHAAFASLEYGTLPPLVVRKKRKRKSDALDFQESSPPRNDLDIEDEDDELAITSSRFKPPNKRHLSRKSNSVSIRSEKKESRERPTGSSLLVPNALSPSPPPSPQRKMDGERQNAKDDSPLRVVRRKSRKLSLSTIPKNGDVSAQDVDDNSGDEDFDPSKPEENDGYGKRKTKKNETTKERRTKGKEKKGKGRISKISLEGEEVQSVEHGDISVDNLRKRKLETLVSEILDEGGSSLGKKKQKNGDGSSNVVSSNSEKKNKTRALASIPTIVDTNEVENLEKEDVHLDSREQKEEDKSNDDLVLPKRCEEEAGKKDKDKSTSVNNPLVAITPKASTTAGQQNMQQSARYIPRKSLASIISATASKFGTPAGLRNGKFVSRLHKDIKPPPPRPALPQEKTKKKKKNEDKDSDKSDTPDFEDFDEYDWQAWNEKQKQKQRALERE